MTLSRVHILSGNGILRNPSHKKFVLCVPDSMKQRKITKFWVATIRSFLGMMLAFYCASAVSSTQAGEAPQYPRPRPRPRPRPDCELLIRKLSAEDLEERDSAEAELRDYGAWLLWEFEDEGECVTKLEKEILVPLRAASSRDPESALRAGRLLALFPGTRHGWAVALALRYAGEARVGLDDKDNLLWALGAAWAAKDPGAASKYAESPEHLALRGGVVRGWAKTAPKEALEWGLRIRDTQAMLDCKTGISLVPGRSVAVRDALDSAIKDIPMVLAKTDPDVALELHERLKYANRLIATRAGGWVKPNMKSVQAQTEYALEGQRLWFILSAWAETNPKAALEWARKKIKDSRERDSAFNAISIGWTKMDPHAAVNLAQTIQDKQLRLGALVGIASKWGHRDLKATVVWAESLRDSQERAAVLETVLGIRSLTDLKAATEWLDLNQAKDRGNGWMGMANANLFSQSLADIAQGLAEKDPQAAMTLLSKVKDAQTRAYATQYMIAGWAKTDPKAAYAYATDEENTSRFSGVGLGLDLTLREWAKSDPEAAIARVAKVGTPHAFRGVAYAWAKATPVPACRWLIANPKGQPMDKAYFLLGIAQALSEMENLH